MRRCVAALSLVVLFGAVRIFADDHSVDFDSRTDFAALKTFAVHDATIGSPRPELDNRLFVKKLGDVIRSGLVAKGLSESADRPDVLVDCTLTGKNYSTKVPTGFRNPRRRDLLITEGTLVIDLTKAGDSAPFWRGVYRDDESAGSKLMQRLPDDARKLIAEYPRRAK